MITNIERAKVMKELLGGCDGTVLQKISKVDGEIFELAIAKDGKTGSEKFGVYYDLPEGTWHEKISGLISCPTVHTDVIERLRSIEYLNTHKFWFGFRIDGAKDILEKTTIAARFNPNLMDTPGNSFRAIKAAYRSFGCLCHKNLEMVVRVICKDVFVPEQFAIDFDLNRLSAVKLYFCSAGESGFPEVRYSQDIQKAVISSVAQLLDIKIDRHLLEELLGEIYRAGAWISEIKLDYDCEENAIKDIKLYIVKIYKENFRVIRTLCKEIYMEIIVKVLSIVPALTHRFQLGYYLTGETPRTILYCLGGEN